MVKIIENLGDAARNFTAGVKLFVVGLGHKDRYLTEFVAGICSFLAGVLASVSPETVGSRSTMSGFTNMFIPELWITLVAIPGLIIVTKNWWYRRLDEDHDIAPVVVMGGYLFLCVFSLLFGLSNWVFWTFVFLMVGVTQCYALSREWTDLRWAVSVVGSFCWVSLTINVFANAEWPWALGVVGYIGLALCNFLTSSRLSAVRRQNMKARGVAWNAGA